MRPSFKRSDQRHIELNLVLTDRPTEGFGDEAAKDDLGIRQSTFVETHLPSSRVELTGGQGDWSLHFNPVDTQPGPLVLLWWHPGLNLHCSGSRRDDADRIAGILIDGKFSHRWLFSHVKRADVAGVGGARRTSPA